MLSGNKESGKNYLIKFFPPIYPLTICSQLFASIKIYTCKRHGAETHSSIHVLGDINAIYSCEGACRSWYDAYLSFKYIASPSTSHRFISHSTCLESRVCSMECRDERETERKTMRCHAMSRIFLAFSLMLWTFHSILQVSSSSFSFFRVPEFCNYDFPSLNMILINRFEQGICELECWIFNIVCAVTGADNVRTRSNEKKTIKVCRVENREKWFFIKKNRKKSITTTDDDDHEKLFFAVIKFFPIYFSLARRDFSGKSELHLQKQLKSVPIDDFSRFFCWPHFALKLTWSSWIPALSALVAPEHKQSGFFPCAQQKKRKIV